MGFEHPENKIGKNGILLANTDKINPRFPDFYIDKKIVLDAKYKRFENWNPNGDNTADLYQIITYLHCLEAKQGGFIFPLEDSDSINTVEGLGTLNGYGGDLYKIALKIPVCGNSFIDYQSKMKEREKEFEGKVRSILEKQRIM
jgi:5-methylcytosine-specific restriction endonuclease McrBC regulatory subunit McrC